MLFWFSILFLNVLAKVTSWHYTTHLTYLGKSNQIRPRGPPNLKIPAQRDTLRFKLRKMKAPEYTSIEL